jgi:hypothetical protein
MTGVETFQAVGAQTQYTQSRQDAVRLEFIKGVVIKVQNNQGRQKGQPSYMLDPVLASI